jgi:hypothetical protein
MRVSQPIGTWALLRFLLPAIAFGICLTAAPPGSAAEANATQAYPAIDGDNPLGHAAECRTIVDVAIQPDGVLRGQVLDPQGDASVEARTGLSIDFLRGQQVVARSRTDHAGRFAVADLKGGVYQIILERPLAPQGHFCRLWPSAGAPPQAATELTLVLEPVVVRGRPNLWVAWPPSLTTTALAVGAIAGPIIYFNAHQDNRVPASP